MSHDLIYLPVDAQERSLVRWYRASRFQGKVEQLQALLTVLEQHATSAEELSRLLELGRARRAELSLEQRIAQLTTELSEVRSVQARTEEALKQLANESRDLRTAQGITVQRLEASTRDLAEARMQHTELVNRISMLESPRRSSDSSVPAEGLKETAAQVVPPPGGRDDSARISVDPKPLAALREAESNSLAQRDFVPSGSPGDEEDVRLELEVQGERIAGDSVPAFLQQMALSLARRRLVPQGFLPFGTGRKRYIAAAEPRHPNGRLRLSRGRSLDLDQPGWCAAEGVK